MGPGESSSLVRLHVVLACHNRRCLTVRAITTFARAAALAGACADFTVFDDGSIDGTAEALDVLDLPVTRIGGDGYAVWARSMAVAENHVLDIHQDGYLVWLNDDVELDGDAIEVALAAAVLFPSAVLVGAMRDPDTGQLTYSGLRRGGFHPLNFVPVEPNGKLQSVETFNGNFLFIPIELARKVGGIDGLFRHALADIDYGIRVRDAGFDSLLLPRTVGSCGRNPERPRGRLIDDWRAFLDAKGGGNYQSMKRILKKWHARLWLGYVGVTYSLWWARRLALAVRPQHSRRSRSASRSVST